MQGTWNISNWSRYYIKFQPVPHGEHKCPQFKVEPINVSGTTKDIYSDNTTKYINTLRRKNAEFLKAKSEGTDSYSYILEGKSENSR
jgi:hypothetical protein